MCWGWWEISRSPSFHFRVQLLGEMFALIYIACFLTLIVTVINGGVHFASVVRIRAISLVVVVPVTCRIIYPLQTSFCPLHLLAFHGLVSQQKKWRFRRKEDRIVFVSVCSTTKRNLRRFPVIAIRKKTILFIWIEFLVVIPEDPSWCQTFRTGAFFINTVFPWNER